MQPRDLNYLLDILEAARLIQSFLLNIDKETFLTDVMRQDAVMRRLEIRPPARIKKS